MRYGSGLYGTGAKPLRRHIPPRPCQPPRTTTTMPGPTHATVTTPPAPTTAPAQTANPIPQGNGGDQDADNNGGPSDGDGNI